MIIFYKFTIGAKKSGKYFPHAIFFIPPEKFIFAKTVLKGLYELVSRT